MSPSEFTFKLTVPHDPEGATVVGVVATHAVEYAALDPAVGAAFVERVRETASTILAGSGPACLVVFAAANGQLTVTIGGQAISQPLPA